MLDPPERAPTVVEPLTDTRRSSESGLTAASSRPNRIKNSPRYGTPNTDNGATNPSFKRLREQSRESSVLASNVANSLTIESPEHELDKPLNGFQNDSDAEHEPTAPYTSSLPTGLCYDVRMRYHCELEPPERKNDYHPEDPRRIFKIYKELCTAGLVRDELLNTGTLIPNPLMRISARELTEEEACLVHDKRHFDFMKSTTSTGH